jgi:hypothetical protein
MSARVDLTLVGQHPEQQRVNIELKAHYCGVENVRKDLEKLIRENTMGVWFHTLESGGPVRLDSILGTFRTAFAQLRAHLGTSKESFLITICSLEAGLLYWKWLTLAGNLELNLEAIESVFQCSLSSGSWHTVRLGSNTIGSAAEIVGTNKMDAESYRGRGAREGFFIYAPSIAKDTYMHLSGRGGSYRIRNFNRSKATKASEFELPNYPTLESLRASGVIAKWLPVTIEDSRHNVINQPGYWYDRIQQVNQQSLPKDTPAGSL